jgi:hypothetical protein
VDLKRGKATVGGVVGEHCPRLLCLSVTLVLSVKDEHTADVREAGPVSLSRSS